MLEKEQLEVLKKSNKTLAIMGRFRSEDEQIRYVFKNNGGKDGKISVADLFAKLKPELRSSSKGTLTIGDTIFNKYELGTPLNEGDKGNSQSILFDSPLLDGTDYSGEEAQGIQEQGKETVNKLIQSLDTVAYFTHSHFTKSLLKIAKHYLFEEANANLEHKIADDAQWYKTLYSDRSFCSRIVQYLTAHEQDEPEIIDKAIKRYLKTLKNSSDKNIYTEEQIEQIAEALIRCKKVMLDGDEEDVTWSKIAKTSQFSWLKNYASDPDYGLSHPQVGKKVGDKNFLAYYNVFMEASDKIHRLIRTQAIHSSIFCWLASKYKKHDLTSRVDAARKMFEIGVESQGERRIRSESREGRDRNLQLIREVEISDDFKEVEEDDNYQDFAAKAEDNIFLALLPDRAVTRKALRLRARNLFKQLNQIAGGKAGQILRENDEFNQLFVKYYRNILNAKTEATIDEFSERLKKEAAKDKELERFNNLDIRGFIDVVINQAKEAEGDNSLKIKVKEAFICEFARASKNRFAEEYLKNKDQIKREEQLAQDLYDLRSMQEVGSQKEIAGGPVYVMTDLSMPDFDNIDDEIKTVRKQKTLAEAQNTAQTSFNTIVTAPKPKKLKDIKPDTAGKVIYKGEEVANVRAKEDNIEIEAQELEKADLINSEEAEIKIDGETYKIQELDIPEISDFPKSEEIKKANEIAEVARDNYQQLTKSMDNILSKYRDEDDLEPYFNRAFRSLMLCEYIQAAPKGTTQIGREDLSNILGLIVDIVEHIGEVDDSKILDGVLSEQPELRLLLEKINLSKYYPAEKGEEISTILQYHYELCKKLNNVKSYLQELTEIKNFFEVMERSDLEIILLNTTVGEYGDINNIDPENFSFNVDSPSVVYLTSQSQASPDSLKTMASSLAYLAAQDYELTNKLQIPIFISSETLSRETVPLPLICPTEKFNLPNFVVPGNESSEKSKQNILVNWEKQHNSYLLLSAAKMLLDSSDFLGEITKFNLPVSIEIRKSFDINLKKNQPIASLLRQFWLSPNCKLLDTLIFTKWLNIVLLARKDNSIDIKEQFGKILDEKLWKPRELPEICNAAFATIKELADIAIKVDYSNQFASPTGLQNTEAYFMTANYGTILDKNPKYIFELPWKDLFAEQLEESTSN